MMSSRPEKDLKFLEDGWIRMNIMIPTREAFVQIGDGVAYDLKMFANKRDFELESVDFDGLVRLFFSCFIHNTLGVSCYPSLFALVSGN